MKNYLVLFLFVSFTSFGQYKEFKNDVKNTVDAVKTTSINTGNSIKKTTLNATNAIKSADTSAVSKQIYKDVKTVIKSVANGLGIASEKVYTVITKKYLIEGITGLLMNIIFVVLYVFLIKFLLNTCRNNQYKDYFVPLIMVSLTAVCVGFGLLMANLSSFTENVGKTFNSEYYTITFIFDNLKELTK